MKRCLFCALLGSSVLFAQANNSLISEARFPWTVVRDNLLKMAQKMPAEDYDFKPTPQIESFAQRLAHIAGANLFVCQGVMGKQSSLTRSNAATKPELIELLKQSSAACDSAFFSNSARMPCPRRKTGTE